MVYIFDLFLLVIKGYELFEGLKEYLKGFCNNIENVSDVKFDCDLVYGFVYFFDFIDVF